MRPFNTCSPSVSEENHSFSLSNIVVSSQVWSKTSVKEAIDSYVIRRYMIPSSALRDSSCLPAKIGDPHTVIRRSEVGSGETQMARAGIPA